MDSERGILGSKLPDNARAQPVFSYKDVRRKPEIKHDHHAPLLGRDRIPRRYRHRLGDLRAMVAQVWHCVAEKYDVLNDLMSFGIHRLW
ncbi:class I SAM-dependent methyltransferase, partial [Cronobacter malonaticus]